MERFDGVLCPFLVQNCMSSQDGVVRLLQYLRQFLTLREIERRHFVVVSMESHHEVTDGILKRSEGLFVFKY